MSQSGLKVVTDHVYSWHKPGLIAGLIITVKTRYITPIKLLLLLERWDDPWYGVACHCYNNVMFRLSRDTDEERDDLKSSWTLQISRVSSGCCVGEYSSLKSLVWSQLIWPGPFIIDYLHFTRTPGAPPGLILFFSQFDQQHWAPHPQPVSTLSSPLLHIFPLIFTAILHFLHCPLPVSSGLWRSPAHCVNLLTIIRKLEQSK